MIYRSTGIILEDIKYDSGEQLLLFADNFSDEKNEKLAACFDKLETKFGKDIVKIGFTRRIKT